MKNSKAGRVPNRHGHSKVRLKGWQVDIAIHFLFNQGEKNVRAQRKRFLEQLGTPNDEVFARIGSL